MSKYDEEEGEAEDDELPQLAGREPSPTAFGAWLVDQFTGDDRFEAVEMDEPGPLEDETYRVSFVYDEQTSFFVSMYAEDGLIRLGLATESEEVSDRIEAAGEDRGVSLTEYLAEALGVDEELDHEVTHFHDDVYYFASDIPFQHIDSLQNQAQRDEIIYYLEGYVSAFSDLIEEE